MSSASLSFSWHQSLDGSEWTFRRATEKAWRPAIVPGCVHADLLRQGAIPDPFVGTNERAIESLENEDWVYRRSFTPEPTWREQEKLELVCEGLDTVATVKLNGRVLGRTENMFVAHRWEVKTLLRAGRNDLEIHFGSPMHYVRTRRQEHRPREINDPIGGCTRIRKQQCSFGWDWGPRLATSGIWLPISLQGWSGNRLASVRVHQRHEAGGRVTLEVEPKLVRRSRAGDAFRLRLRQAGKVVAEGDGLRLDVPAPQLWWPQGQGEQPLYELECEYRFGDRLVDRWSRRIGLRTIALERSEDRWGECFQFRVNDRPIFAKGANWIPAHALTAGLARSDYEPALRAAAAANMNMIRVWGGGIYESEDFYDLCDELGLLVWQDFMFACTLYPGDAAFLKSVRVEAEQQVVRLRHRACLALWCGNNEVESLNPDALKNPATQEAYDALFERLLREIVASEDGVTAYWRSSPLGAQNTGAAKDAAKLDGDWHDWDVWHARQPVKSYEKSNARFVSEFGMQSLSSAAVTALHSPREEWNLFSPGMENHQKNPSGNAIILDYVARRYRFPEGYAQLAYLSQLNQAYCMKVAVEHWRRAQPRTMGAIYWQLNDCWPVASWSSLEFGGNWKPLHHAARRFFAPLLLSAHVHGDEDRGIGNRLRSTVRRVDLYTVSDHPQRVRATLTWALWHLGERRVLRDGKTSVDVAPRTSRCRERLDFDREIERHGRDNLVLQIALEAPGLPRSEDVVLFTAPRNLALERAAVSLRVQRGREKTWSVELESPVYQHGVWLETESGSLTVSDNGFDLLPGVGRRVEISAPGVTTAGALRRRLRVRTLAAMDAQPLG